MLHERQQNEYPPAKARQKAADSRDRWVIAVRPRLRSHFGPLCNLKCVVDLVLHMCWLSRTGASPLTARVDPVACPARRVLQRLLFTREAIERIELVAAFGARAIGAFEQQVG